MFKVYSVSMMVCWFIAISVLCIMNYILYTDLFMDKFEIRTYYYRNTAVLDGDSFDNLLTNSYPKKLLTDFSWILYFGFTIPFMVIVMLMPLYLQGYMGEYLFLPLILWIINSYSVSYRKKFNKYNQLPENQSSYKHRYIPLIVTLNVVICILLSLVLLCMANTPFDKELPFIISIIFLVALDILTVHIDRISEHFDMNMLSNYYFKKLLKCAIVLFVILIIAILLYYYSILGFDYTFESYINHNSMQQLYDNDFL